MSEEDDSLDGRNRFSVRDKKAIYKWGFGALVIIGVVLFANYISKPEKLVQKPTLKPATVDENLLAEDEFVRFRRGQEEQSVENKQQQNQINGLKSSIEVLTDLVVTLQHGDEITNEKAKEIRSQLEKRIKDIEIDKNRPVLPDLGPKPGESTGSEVPPPAVGSKQTPFSYPPAPGNTGMGDQEPVDQIQTFSENEPEMGSPELVGGTGWIGLDDQPLLDEAKKRKRYLLPPSMMSAKLISGIDALTNKQGQNNPEQIFFMVDAPAVLPNHIRRDFSGCIIVANAHGNLAKERVGVRLVNLACVSDDDKFAINAEINGFATDNSDGKRDLAGHVYSKDSQKMAWVVAASIVSELGNTLSLSSFEQNNNVLGTSTVLDVDEAYKNSVGSAVQDTGNAYRDIVLEYVKQSGPVIEMAPLKEATLFIAEEVWLEIEPTEKEDDNNA